MNKLFAAEQKKSLVVFYSRKGQNYWPAVGTKELDVGNTETLVNALKGLDGFDIVKVEEAEPYPLGYRRTTEVVKEENTSGKARAYKKTADIDFTKYDIVFIGHPVWWSRLPPPFALWLKDNAEGLSGKKIAEFGTHEGSGLSGTTRHLREIIGKADYTDVFSVYGHDATGSGDNFKEWIERIRK